MEVEYEPLPAVLDPRAGDPMARWEQREGDVAGAFARAAHVVRTERVIGRLTNALLEGSGALAVPDGDRLTVWTSSLSAHRPRTQLAQMLRRDEASLRVIVPDVGGGFGSRGTLPVETPVVAFAAAELGRPVRWTEDRRERSASSPQGRGIRGWVELALDARRSASSRCAAACWPTSVRTCCRAPRSRRTPRRCSSPARTTSRRSR